MNKYVQLLWKILRYFKPVRTFWMTLATMLPVMSTGIANGDTGLTGVNWVTALSGAASAAIFNFIVLMSTGDSMWSEKKENATMSLMSDTTSDPKYVGKHEAKS